MVLLAASKFTLTPMLVMAQVSSLVFPLFVVNVAVGTLLEDVTTAAAVAVQPLEASVPTTVYVPAALKVAAAVGCPLDQT